METTQLCRLCLENGTELLDIFDNFENTTIVSIIEQYYRFQAYDILSNYLCAECWTNTKNFHQFYQKVELKHKDYFESIWNAVVKEEQKAIESTHSYIVKSEEVTEEALTIPVLFVENNQNDGVDDSITIEKSVQEQSLKEERLDKSMNHDQISKMKSSPREMKNRKETQSESDAMIRKFCRIECEVCLLKFESFTEAKKHYRIVHKTNGYLTCCGKKFHDRGSVMSHVRKHLNPKPISAKREYQAGLEIRNKRRSEENVLIREYCNMKCKFCSKEFQTFSEANKHYKTVHDTEGFLICCNQRIYRRAGVLKHIHSHANPEVFKCHICDRQLASSRSLKCHIENHESIHSRPYKCDLCSYSFVKLRILEQHKRLKHCTEEDKTFICDICNKKFISKGIIAHHMRTSHITSNSHVCEICARLFRNKQVLKAHMKTHSATINPKVQCDICGSWLKNKSYLLHHLKRHQAVPTECPICRKMYYNVRGHIRFTHREASHQCAICGKYLKSTLSLKEHTAVHTGEDLYKCPYCTKTFKSSANMYSHKKKAHLTEWKREKLERSIVNGY